MLLITAVACNSKLAETASMILDAGEDVKKQIPDVMYVNARIMLLIQEKPSDLTCQEFLIDAPEHVRQQTFD